jgi:hypothetical protein
MNELLQWLTKNQLDKYYDILVENDITNLELLAELSEDDIKELGFTLVDRKRFSIGIKNNEEQSIISPEEKELLLKLPYIIT